MDHQAAIDDDGADSCRTAAVDKEIAAVQRLEMRPVGIEQNEIGGAARRQHTGGRVQADDLGAAADGEIKDLPGRDSHRIRGEHLLDFCGDVHFTKQIEAVVGGGAVRAQADPDFPCQHGMERCPAGGQFEVALGTDHYAALSLGKDIEISRVHPDAMDADRIPIEDAQGIQVADWSRAKRITDLIDFVAGFGDMDKEGRLVLAAQFLGSDQGAG